MKRPLSLGVTVLLALMVLALKPTPAGACTCIDRSLGEYADDLAYAFLGRQIDRRSIDDDYPQIGNVLTFEVDQVFHGSAGSKVDVKTPGACPIDFAEQGRTGVAVFLVEGEPTVSLCGSAVSATELASVFGEPYSPTVDSSPRQWTLPVVAVGAIAVVIVGLVGSLVVLGIREQRRSLR